MSRVSCWIVIDIAGQLTVVRSCTLVSTVSAKCRVGLLWFS